MPPALSFGGGWFLEFTLNSYFGWKVPWIIWSVLLTGGAVPVYYLCKPPQSPPYDCSRMPRPAPSP